MLINRRKNNISIYTTVRNKLTRATHTYMKKFHKHVKEDKSLEKSYDVFYIKLKTHKIIHTHTHLRDTYLSGKIANKSKEQINAKLRVVAEGA